MSVYNNIFYKSGKIFYLKKAIHFEKSVWIGYRLNSSIFAAAYEGWTDEFKENIFISCIIDLFVTNTVK